MLEIRNLESGYGALRVLRGVSLKVPKGKVVTLLGGNGAGKTTTMKTVVGVIRATGGEIELEGEPIARLSSHAIFSRGIALVPQGRELFPDMTVGENLELGALARGTAGTSLSDLLDGVFDTFPRLRERVDQRAGSLSGGEQQMLAISRALMGNPRVLLMDEPSEGLAPLIVAEVGRTIARLKSAGQSIVLVEQNVKLALELADDVVILNTGRVVFAGSVDDVRGNDELVTQQLGVF